MIKFEIDPSARITRSDDLLERFQGRIPFVILLIVWRNQQFSGAFSALFFLPGPFHKD
jgi:hypothetical protein